MRAVKPAAAPTAAQLMRHNAMRTQAEKFVAQTFFGPMFKAMRASPFKSEILSGGRGGGPVGPGGTGPLGGIGVIG